MGTEMKLADDKVLDHMDAGTISSRSGKRQIVITWHAGRPRSVISFVAHNNKYLSLQPPLRLSAQSTYMCHCRIGALNSALNSSACSSQPQLCPWTLDTYPFLNVFASGGPPRARSAENRS